MNGVGSTQLSAQTVAGGDGNDVIDIGAFGLTANVSSTLTYQGVGATTVGTGNGAITGCGATSADTASGLTAGGTTILTGIYTADAGATTVTKVNLKVCTTPLSSALP